MQIDGFTIIVGACAAILLFGVAFFYFWWQDRRSTWLAWWTGPYFLGGLGIALFIPRGLISDWLSIAIANAMLFAAFGMVWQGARAFVGRGTTLLWVVLPALAWMGLCALPGFMEATTVRIIIASVVVASLTLLTAHELRTDPSERLPSRNAAILVLLTFSIFIGIRVPLVGYLPFPMGGGELHAGWLAFVNLVVLAHVGAFAMLMVSLSKERREAEQRNFAMLDPLTGLMNRRAFMSAVERAARRRPGYDREPMALLVLDLDKFKLVNDRFGHDVGDRVLVSFARVAESVTRPTDQLYRLGGEEFCIILPNVARDEAITIAERIREIFAVTRVNAKGQVVGTTVSIGIAEADHSGFNLEVLLEAADAAVYEAKARGRNQVVLADPTALMRELPDAMLRRA